MKTLEYPELGIRINPGPGRDTTMDTVSTRLTNGSEIAITNSLIHQPRLLSLSASLGIKATGKPDFTVMTADRRASCAGVFTRNRCPSVTVLRNRRVLTDGKAQLIAVNSGNANVFTPTGEHDVAEIAALLAVEFQVPADDILICSTGVIGVPLPMEKFRAGIPGLLPRLEPNRLEAASEAILTTDVGPKTASVQLGNIRLCGMAKGAGMIEPNLATMLVYLFTDAAFESSELDRALRFACDDSFNCISVDTDTSTSDSVVLLSTGAEAPNVSLEDFSLLLRALCLKLARDIVSQGEGVTKIIEACVETDVSSAFSQKLAKQIINSPLFKCAVHGSDPNWGRVVMAIGKGDHDEGPAVFDPAGIELSLQDLPVFRSGSTLDLDKSALRQALKDERVARVNVRIGDGRYRRRVWGCDLSNEYVAINADYTT